MLFVPATSTAVERVFSKGRHLLPFTRNRLSPSSICAYLCLGLWACQGLVTVEDFLKAIKMKTSKRKRSDLDIEVIPARTIVVFSSLIQCITPRVLWYPRFLETPCHQYNLNGTVYTLNPEGYGFEGYGCSIQKFDPRYTRDEPYCQQCAWYW
jgi:hypothetical protein